MYDAKALLAALRHETACAVHLARQLKPKHLAFRLTPAQRSTEELLRYQAIQIHGLAAYLVTGTWDAWDGLEAKAAGLALKDFPAAMAAQQRAVARLIGRLSAEDLATRRVTAMSGRRMALGAALVELVAFAAAYKMQLFLQAKAAGLADLKTSDLWRGKRPAAPKTPKKK